MIIFRFSQCKIRAKLPTNLAPILVIAWIALALNRVQGQTTADQKTAGEKFKSVTVLSNMPADQMGKVMNIMSASLGVNCGFCHEGTNFAKDSVGHKEVARKMLAMTLELNNRHFEGRTEVTCNTCHRGHAIPVSNLSLDRMPPIPLAPPTSTKPSTGDIWTRYLAALGGRERMEAIKTRHVIAKRIEPSGTNEPEELWQTHSGKSRMVTQYGTTAVVEAFDGSATWKRANQNEIELKPDESEQIRAEAIIAFGMRTDSLYSEPTYRETVRIQDRDCHLVEAKTKNKMTERLFFDAQSDLLVRRIASIPTVLGPYEYQVDYQDYKEFGGVLQPTQIRFAVPNIAWTRQVLSIETNVDLDESQFRKP